MVLCSSAPFILYYFVRGQAVKQAPRMVHIAVLKNLISHKRRRKSLATIEYPRDHIFPSRGASHLSRFNRASTIFLQPSNFAAVHAIQRPTEFPRRPLRPQPFRCHPRLIKLYGHINHYER